MPDSETQTDEMKDEYNLDYSRAKPNRFAESLRESAELYAEIYEADGDLQDLTETALADFHE